MSNVNLFWISKEMKPGKWYDIEDETQLSQYQRIIDKRFGWPKFQLSLSPDYKQVKKTEI
jgi:hypothetical protein